MPPPSIESQRVEIDGVTYALRVWDYADGERWAFKLLRMLAPAVGTHASEGDAVSAVLDSLDEQALEAFAAVCRKYTDLVGSDPNGRETVLPLQSVAANHMRGRYLTMASLMKEHGARQFASFFGGLPALLASLAGGKAAT